MDDILDSTIHGIGADPARVTVINNCHDYQNVIKRSEEPLVFQETTKSTVSVDQLSAVLSGNDTKFISIGRYSPEKGHVRLMNAFNTYRASHPDTWLIIIGGVGTLYEDAVAHAKSLAASDHIILIYSMQNPMPVLKNCDLFLLSSFYEGRPIVLMEAASLGLPLMACDVNGCHGFMTEYQGTLVDNSEEGILHGMQLFAEGKVQPVQIDFDRINAASAAQTEALIEDCTHISHSERTH